MGSTPEPTATYHPAADGGSTVPRPVSSSLSSAEPAPRPRLAFAFGGLYQESDPGCGQADVPNPATDPPITDCPPKFHRHKVGRILTDAKCGATQYICLGPATLKALNVYGTYQEMDPPPARCEADNNVPNWFGRAIRGCPPGSQPAKYGRTIGPEARCGVSQYLCVDRRTDSKRDGPLIVGGYQRDDCGVNNVPDDTSKDVRCPDGSEARKVGRVKAPEGTQCGADQYLCIVPHG